MNNIMIIPLDERPCNTNYVKYLTKDTPYNLLLPPIELLGDKKQKARITDLHDWIKQNSTKIDHLVLSIDMLIYGGIVPSRLHYNTFEELKTRLEIIPEIKKLNPNLKIYAFSLIMRNPTYSSSDEEPDYYEEYGREIHLKGVFEHKITLQTINEEEQTKLNEINNVLPQEIYQDYIGRRHINNLINLEVVNLLEQNIIDYLVIPQDDASEFGLTKMDQDKVLSYIKEKPLQDKFLMYPDADAVVNALLARTINKHNKIKPKFFIHYATTEASDMIPLFEDRPLSSSINSQIEVVDGVITQNVKNADLILAVNATSIMRDINSTDIKDFDYEYNQLRDLDTFIKNIKAYNKPVIIADVAYSNGSDHELIKRLVQKNMLFTLAGYAAWNTSGNTLGTCIAQGVLFHHYGKTQSHLNFLGLRYVEDYLYMTKVRKEVSNNVLPSIGLNYFNAGDKRGKVSKIVYSMLNKYITEYLSSEYMINVTDCYMPWARMFEVGIDVEVFQPFNLEDHTVTRLNQFKEENISTGKIVFLGDSITEHYNLTTHFNNHLVYNRGISGDNTFGVLKRMEESVYSLSPSKVFLLIGTNDICNGTSVEDIVFNIKEIVRRIKINSPSTAIYIQSIYPINSTNHHKINQDYVVCRSNQTISNINNQIKKIKDITYINMTPVLSDPYGELKLEYTEEGLHISALGYEAITKELLQYI